MIRALVIKELRETAGIAAIAIAVFLAYLSGLMGGSKLFSFLPGFAAEPPLVPFVQDGFEWVYGCIAAGLAIVLGFRQSAWEPSQGTSLYLLHRPLSRNAIMLVKLASGAGLLLTVTLLPIVVYAVWAATPGTHAGPFEWSMAAPSFRTWFVIAVVYLGAFASGIRPARWVGSRLLPLASVLVPVGASCAPFYWWFTGFPLTLATVAWLTGDILFAAQTRDY